MAAPIPSKGFAAVVLAAATAGMAAQIDTPAATLVFSSHTIVRARLEAPLGGLFAAARKNAEAQVAGTLTYADEATGRDVVLNDVRISVRGNTSKNETECDFPKLKLRFTPGTNLDSSMFRGLKAIKIGTHCAERPDAERTPKGRLANDKAPHREAFIYRLLDVVGIVSFKARPAEITYVEPQRTIVRKAFFLEDDGDAVRRIGAQRELTPKEFTNAKDAFAVADVAKLAFAEALIGNFDWCLKLTAGDTYRCDAREPLWNIAALARAEGGALPLMYDFDISGMVTGPHGWFPRVLNEGFTASGSHQDIEAIVQVQRTRSLFSRAELDAARQYFVEKKAAAYQALDEAQLDPDANANIKAYMDGFFGAIENDAAFYRPIVTGGDVMAYADAGRKRTVCNVLVPAGTPVDEPAGANTGTMVHANILDALWRWAMNRSCDAMRTGPVWIDRSAISTEYPNK